MIAERRRKALKEVLEENQQLEALIATLEIENTSCKTLLKSTEDLVNTLKVCVVRILMLYTYNMYNSRGYLEHH